MSTRSKPIETGLVATVKYPSALFSLEKDEFYPYERFASNVLHVAVEALHNRGLPESIVIDFTRLLSGCSPWAINASMAVTLDGNGKPLFFTVSTPELAPAEFYLYCAVVASKFFDEQAFEEFERDPRKLGAEIQVFVDAASAAVRAYRESGIGPAIRASYERLNLQILDIERYALLYDLLTKEIAYHEVAHGYVRQFSRVLTDEETRAFEIVVDLVATEWFYNGWIKNTPDTPEYRRFRGIDTYSETIFSNSLMAMQAQQSRLILWAIGGAQRNGGHISLSGGKTHPPGMLRYMLQHVHLYTLVASNFSKVLSADQLRFLETDCQRRMDVLVKAGIVTRGDALEMADGSQLGVVAKAAELISEFDVPELKKMVEFLRQLGTRIGKKKPNLAV
jgi:hypothetical protein